MKGYVSVIMLTLLLISMLTLAFNIQPVKSDWTWTETVYIRADGSIDPPTAPISTVDNVTYMLTDNIVDAAPSEDDIAIVVERDNIVLDGAGHTLQALARTWGRGISLSGRSNITIKNTHIENFWAGIVLSASSNNSISGNHITNNRQRGIWLGASSNYNIISGNNITNNCYGVEIWYSSNNTVSGNSITNNDWGIKLGESSNNNISGNNITANNYYGIALSGSDYNSISGNNITNNSCGISLGGSSGNTVSGNNITNNNKGIWLYYSSNNSIVGNVFVDGGLVVRGSYGSVVVDNTVNGKPLVYLEEVSDYVVGDAGQVILVNCTRIIVENLNLSRTSIGVQLWGTTNTTISGNNITNNSCGIVLEASSNYNSISRNDITANSEYGVSLSSSLYNSISGNHITNNRQRGIWLGASSNYNIISGNNITNNQFGIYLVDSLNNRFWHNNLIDNRKQVGFYDSGYANDWDDGYPSGGNYWSDYNGTDLYSGTHQNQTGSDGIGDTPYVINEDHRDNYPLTNPWPSGPGLHELEVALKAPTSLSPGSSTLIEATVSNKGVNNEQNVTFSLFVNNTIVNSTTISLLEAGSSHTINYLWTPTAEGTYNVTGYAHPVAGETYVENNRLTKFVAVAVSAPPEVRVGVKAGDWIKVEYTISGWPSGQPYPEWLKVEFLSVEGTNATVRVTMHMSDGTEQNATAPVIIGAGGGEAFGLSGFVIPANLTIGDTVYITGYGNVTIEGEATRTYAGASRTVVHASFSQYGTQLTYYWDKQTGVMVEASVTSGGMTGTAKATETNMWEVAPSGLLIEPTYILAIIIIIIAAATIAIIVRRKKTPEKPTL